MHCLIVICYEAPTTVSASVIIGCVEDEAVPWEMVLGEFICIYKHKGSPEVSFVIIKKPMCDVASALW